MGKEWEDDEEAAPADEAPRRIPRTPRFVDCFDILVLVNAGRDFILVLKIDI
jgi:hypothetical protein